MLISNAFDALWLNTSLSFKRFHQPLLQCLSQRASVAQWDYHQTQDEASSLDVPVQLLQDYLQSRDRPVHLIGHSTGGLVGLLYARQYPERVKSLTLLAVGAQASLDWLAHYYFHLGFLTCGRYHALAQMVPDLFGEQTLTDTRRLVKLLLHDLATSPSPHSLLQTVSLSQAGVSVPLLVCGAEDDVIVDSHELKGWHPWLKQGDRLWQTPQGQHFFHCIHPQAVSEPILDFWQSVPEVTFVLHNQPSVICS
jgi:pimeloyl-ACP methyl ester carboxylesterase